MRPVLFLLGPFLLLVGCSQTRFETQSLWVDKAYETNCPPIGYIGPKPDKCLRVRVSANDTWYGFSQPIKGFEYEEGYLYELQVLVGYDISGAMDVPPSYTLLKAVSKTKPQ